MTAGPNNTSEYRYCGKKSRSDVHMTSQNQTKHYHKESMSPITKIGQKRNVLRKLDCKLLECLSVSMNT